MAWRESLISRAEGYTILVDGKKLEENKSTYASVVQLMVENTILYAPTFITEDEEQPIELPTPFASEFVTYSIEGANILVSVKYNFHNETEVNIHRYYGAQWMAQGKELYFVNGHTKDFCSQRNGYGSIENRLSNFQSIYSER